MATPAFLPWRETPHQAPYSGVWGRVARPWYMGTKYFAAACRFGAFPKKLEYRAHAPGFFKSDDPARAIVARTIKFFTPDLFWHPKGALENNPT